MFASEYQVLHKWVRVLRVYIAAEKQHSVQESSSAAERLCIVPVLDAVLRWQAVERALLRPPRLLGKPGARLPASVECRCNARHTRAQQDPSDT